MNTADGRLSPSMISGAGATTTWVLTWQGTRAVWAPASGGTSLHVGTSAPVDGSVFWWDTDAT